MSKQNEMKPATAGAIVLLILAVFFWARSAKAETWSGFYYPEGCLECTEDYIYSPPFETLAQCQAWINRTLATRNGNPRDAYECGKNCDINQYSMYVCEETID